MRIIRKLSPAFALALIVACGDDHTSPTAVEASRAPAPDPRVARHTALGAYRFSVAPEVFGTTTPVDNTFLYNAEKAADGRVWGHVRYVQSADGSTFHYTASVTCMGIYDYDGRIGNRAKIGALIEASDDPDAPAGKYLWWQAIDDGEEFTGVDKSTLIGIGDQAANEAFCASDRVPRFGPFTVKGVLIVK